MDPCYTTALAVHRVPCKFSGDCLEKLINLLIRKSSGAILGSPTPHIALPQTARTGDVQVCHLHINPAFAEQDLNTVLPAARLHELAKLGEIGAVAPSHYSYMGYTLRPQRLLGESLPGMVQQLREEHVNVVVLIPV